MDDLTQLPDVCKFHPGMLKGIVPPTQQEDFTRRWYKAMEKYKLKWGNYPGWKGRNKILAGLLGSYKRGWIGNSKHGFSLKQSRAAHAAARKLRALGMSGKEIMDYRLAGPGKKKLEYEMRLHEAEERRAARRKQTEG